MPLPLTLLGPSRVGAPTCDADAKERRPPLGPSRVGAPAQLGAAAAAALKNSLGRNISMEKYVFCFMYSKNLTSK